MGLSNYLGQKHTHISLDYHPLTYRILTYICPSFRAIIPKPIISKISLKVIVLTLIEERNKRKGLTKNQVALYIVVIVGAVLLELAVENLLP